MHWTTLLTFFPETRAQIQAIDWRLPWVIVASFLAGTLNAVAGGGSFLSFPAMLAIGLGPIQANATNTVALWPGQLTSIAGYRDEVRKHLSLAWKMALAGLVGGSIGAIILLNTPATTFIHLVPWLLLFAAVVFALSEPAMRYLQRRQRTRPASAERDFDGGKNPWPLVVATSLVCFYIGYFGAGAGFLIMAMLAIFGIQSIREVNALKVVATTIANGIAVLTFVVERQVIWHLCLLMMLTAVVGGYVGARYSRRLSARIMRVFVVVIGLGMAAYFFLRAA